MGRRGSRDNLFLICGISYALGILSALLLPTVLIVMMLTVLLLLICALTFK